MTRTEYFTKLAELYKIANMSDSDNPQRPDWLKGNECEAHCQAFDKIAHDMGLSECWTEAPEAE